MSIDYHEKNKCFTIYKDWETYVSLLGSDELAGKLFKALFAFASRGEEPDFDGALKMAFEFMKNAIDRDGAKWSEVCEKHAEAGRKGGRPKKPKGSDENLPEPKKADKEKDKEKEKEKEKDTDTVNVIVKENDAQGENTTTTTQYGKYVFMTEKEFSALLKDYGKTKLDDYIMRFDSYIERKNITPYKNSSAVIRSWLEKDGAKKKSDHSYDLDLIMKNAMENVPVYPARG